MESVYFGIIGLLLQKREFTFVYYWFICFFNSIRVRLGNQLDGVES